MLNADIISFPELAPGKSRWNLVGKGGFQVAPSTLSSGKSTVMGPALGFAASYYLRNSFAVEIGIEGSYTQGEFGKIDKNEKAGFEFGRTTRLVELRPTSVYSISLPASITYRYKRLMLYAGGGINYVLAVRTKNEYAEYKTAYTYGSTTGITSNSGRSNNIWLENSFYNRFRPFGRMGIGIELVNGLSIFTQYTGYFKGFEFEGNSAEPVQKAGDIRSYFTIGIQYRIK